MPKKKYQPKIKLPKVQFVLGENAKVPTKATDGSAGYDIYAPSFETIPDKTTWKYDINLQMAIPRGYYGRILSRSSVANNKLITLAGVIDSDYTGWIQVLFYNLGDDPYVIHEGDRIAQIVISPCLSVEFEQVDLLDETARGAGGFGSTGIGAVKPPTPSVEPEMAANKTQKRHSESSLSKKSKRVKVKPSQ